MMVVRVELWSARDGSRVELARMRIANDGDTTAADPSLGSYVGYTLKGRSSRALDRGIQQRKGRVPNWPRHQLHVWNLVARMLQAMGYGRAGPEPEGHAWTDDQAATAEALFHRVAEALPGVPPQAILRRFEALLEAGEPTPREKAA